MTSESPVTVYIQERAIQGVSEGPSKGGLMLYIQEPLEVSVALAGKVYRGQLVRVQRMTHQRTGLAIQLEDGQIGSP
jgi:hypothetical protein